MTKAEMIRDPNSCLNRAAFDEPIFVLRANDPEAAHVVEYWAKVYLAGKARYDAKDVTEANIAKAHQAEDVALRMRTWVRRRAQQQQDIAEERDSDRDRAGVYSNGDPR